MSNRPAGVYDTFTISRIWTASNAEGATALVLETKEAGTIAIVLTLERIAALQKHLAEAEVALRRPTGRA